MGRTIKQVKTKNLKIYLFFLFFDTLFNVKSINLSIVIYLVKFHRNKFKKNVNTFLSEFEKKNSVVFILTLKMNIVSFLFNTNRSKLSVSKSKLYSKKRSIRF